MRDKDYIVEESGNGDKKVVIIDSSTGRLMPISRWTGFIHQAVEVVEGCKVG